MTDIFRYIDLPKVPEYLILNIQEIEKQKNIYEINRFFYKQFEVSKELTEFLKSIFNFEFAVQYQIIRKFLPIHKDRKRTECFNYLINNGGDNTTLDIYEEDMKTIIYSQHIEICKWHWINVSKYHGVSNLNNTPRVSLTVTPLSKIF